MPPPRANSCRWVWSHLFEPAMISFCAIPSPSYAHAQSAVAALTLCNPPLCLPYPPARAVPSVSLVYPMSRQWESRHNLAPYTRVYPRRELFQQEDSNQRGRPRVYHGDFRTNFATSALALWWGRRARAPLTHPHASMRRTFMCCVVMFPTPTGIVSYVLICTHTVALIRKIWPYPIPDQSC